MMRNAAGALGIVALFAAVVVGLLATFGVFGEKAPVSPTLPNAEAEVTQQQAEQQAERASAASVGETVTAGDVSWTVTDARQETELHAYTFPPNDIPGNFVTMDFTVENVTDEPVTLTGEEITIFDQSGMEYQPEPDRNNTFVEPEKNLLFSEFGLIEAGQTKEGTVNFGVLNNSSGFIALLGDTDPTVNEGRYVDLGF